MNMGYADLNKREGLYLDTFRDNFDKYRLQLYDFCVVKHGGLTNMSDQTLLETGCGRAGGLNYIASVLHP
jgi:hypothetical protein